MHFDFSTAAVWLGLGATLIIGALQLAGWRNKLVVYCLVTAGAICALVGAFSSLAVGLWPSLSHFAISAATPSSVFALIALAGALTLFSPLLRENKKFDSEQFQKLLTSNLDAQKNELKGEIGGLQNHFEALRKFSNAETARLVEIERRTAFPSNLGDTLGQALETAEQLRLSQIGRIRNDVKEANKTFVNAQGAIVHLLDFAINVATRDVLSGLLLEKPLFDKMTPPNEENQRNELEREINYWMQNVISAAQNAAYGQDIIQKLRESYRVGQDAVRRMPTDQRPKGIDGIAFADFFALAFQCDVVSEKLQIVIKTLDENNANSLQNLRRFAPLPKL